MHERRISQRNTDAANPTQRPPAPGATTTAWNALQADGRRVSLGEAKLVTSACWRPPPSFLLLFLHRLRLYLDVPRARLSSSTTLVPMLLLA